MLRLPGLASVPRLLAIIPMAAAMQCQAADARWFESGDALLRADLQLLNDAGIIRLPISQWPLPAAALGAALENAKPAQFATNAAVSTALQRVEARLKGRAKSGLRLGASATVGSAPLLRDYDAFGRESGELGAAVEFDADSGRVSLGVHASGVVDPEDGQRLRADGSHATVNLGNWLISANTLDRFWGPAHESSLILSNNARPMPSLTLERATATPFDVPVLEWLGPWRFHLSVGRMEDEREDIDAPLFLAWRVSIMPTAKIELGFSRTAQFCGKQLSCDFSSITEMLIGNDNVGIDASLANEPGNQMAGFDMRWNSPIGDLPYAVYSQMIGEDESNYLPVKYLAQFGLEAWKPFADGSYLQGFLEYADTTCSANRNPPRFGCAYNQGKFSNEGYRYHGRVLGHTTDRDAETWSTGVGLAARNGDWWSVTVRRSHLNRDNVGDVNNTVAHVPTKYAALELGWRGALLGDSVSVDVGAESIEPWRSDRSITAFGFVRWQHEFAP